MTAGAIQRTTEALQELIVSTTDSAVMIGSPEQRPADGPGISLFLYHLTPNADLRNETHHRPPVGNGAVRAEPVEALPFDLRYLITVFRTTGTDPAASPTELLTLGKIIQALQANPVLTGARLPGQTVRLTPDPVSVDEMNRIWGLLPETAYRISVAYLATPVFVEGSETLSGELVRGVKRHTGVATDPPDLAGRHSSQQGEGLEP
jgi:hypothetical protein